MVREDGDVQPRLRATFPLLGEELPGKNVDQFVAHGAMAGEASDLTVRASQGETIHVNTQRQRRDGKLVDVELHAVPVRSMESVGIYELHLDITGRKRGEEELKRYAAELEAARDAHEKPPRTSTPARSPTRGSRRSCSRSGRTSLAKELYRRDDMHAVVHRYFADLRPVLDGLFRALVPGGRFVVVVGDSLLAGVYVPGDLLLARLGVTCGFRVESVEVARPRRSGQRRSFELRESIVTLERPRATR